MYNIPMTKSCEQSSALFNSECYSYENGFLSRNYQLLVR